jgi:hypothetical protein
MPDTFPMALSEYLDYLPGYDLNDWSSEALNVARAVIDSENYFMRGYVFPGNGSDSIAGGVTFEGLISAPAHSIILFMTGYSSSSAGFKFQLYENGSKQNLFGRTYARQDVTGMYQTHGGEILPDVPIGPAWFTDPMIIMPPGRIVGQVTNMSVDTATIQVYLQMAIPITRETLSQNVQKTGSS